jgi:CubicO group peptidase (beta-lactamase class C family)
MKYRLFFVVVALATAIWPSGRGSAQEVTYQIFDRYLQPLVHQIGMPGLSALIVRNGVVEWEKGYGFANVERGIRPTIDTPYAIGGVTQAVTAVLLGVCIDRYRFDIDRPMRDFVPTFPEPNATVRHVLAHASTGRFRYDPAAYASLTRVVEICSQQGFRETTAAEALDRLIMPRSVPGLDLARPEGAAARLLFDDEDLRRYLSLLTEVATPYRVDSSRRAMVSEFPSYGLDAAGGLVATAHDLKNFETAVDQGIPLSRSTLELMWTATTITDANDNRIQLPTGLGWFVTRESGQNLVWTFGHIPDASSALILKLPSKNLTLILLSNSGLLVSGYNFETGHVTESPFVKIFLRLFI